MRRTCGGGCCRKGLESSAEAAHHRKRRERKEHVGELVQMDGSFHDWLEERGPGGCLMNMVDDASGDTLARLGSEETIWAAAGVLRARVKKYGIPVALYTDWKNVMYGKRVRKNNSRGGAGAAIWQCAAAGDPHHCGQYAAGERSSREKPRYHQDRW